MSAGPDELRDIALAVGREAAVLARAMREEGVDVADTKSSGTDVVTRADRAVEDLLRRRILEQRPDDSILGEEGDDHAGTSGVRWIVDPIDGTVNYLYGLRDCAVSVAAERDGELVAGAVVGIGAPVEYAAATGHGATRDGQPISVRPDTPVGQRLVHTGFGYRAEVRAHQSACLARLLPQVRDIRRFGSAALDICHVADGSGDAYVEEGPMPWDWSAAAVVLREAGGRFGVLPGTMALEGWPAESVVVATPADGWDAFVGLLREAGFLA
ncbi:inositol monophosphatase family protein [Nocardioides hwasunensis]|uniref:Inositol-1-monophosphatase n=1 Tax=Nocardioides hwasunensis TaxID=397258 RepID=A0ABR8MF71_9ACTN|nr:inositol monophosphatase family protein [Nocardioides hwasunensis]MBD3914553.1 inositol monophosphatase [Nocardioides hwasunensis]